MLKIELPPPACPRGYTTKQLEEILGPKDGRPGFLAEFNRWFYGQTAGVCEGKRYNHEERREEPTECADSPHGVVVYPWDLERFVRGLPPLD